MEQSKPAHGHAIPGKHGSPKNHCFARGKDNPDGMHLKFYLDEAARRAICNFTLTQRYTGPPGHSHGGIIATILDEAMGKVNKFRNVLALTKSMQVEYLKPVPLDKPLTVTGCGGSRPRLGCHFAATPLWPAQRWSWSGWSLDAAKWSSTRRAGL